MTSEHGEGEKRSSDLSQIRDTPELQDHDTPSVSALHWQGPVSASANIPHPEEPETEPGDEDDEFAEFEEQDLGDNSAHLADSKPSDEFTTTSHTEPAEDQSEDISTARSPDLDALLSPTRSTAPPFPKRDSVRDSVAASDTTDADDETRFSTVLLSSARSSVDPSHAPESHDADESPIVPSKPALDSDTDTETLHDERRDTLDGSELIRLVHTNRSHKKTASTSTIVSGIISRLEETRDEEPRRSSLDGQHRLQEEFGRKQEVLTTESEIDWNFWGDVVSDYQSYAASHPEQLAKAIERGIPKSLRGMIWQLMSASKDPELEQTYLRLLKDPSPHEKAITRDLGRTFPHHAFFTDGHGIGQENLFNVLKAYSLYDSQVGYCQGLPFIVAILLLNMPDEEAFCLLVRLMHSYDLRGHFLPEMPKLQQRMFQFDRLVEELLPVLHVHFLRQGIKSSMYCSQWFLTMFSYKFPLDVVFRIYDNVLASGVEALFSFSVVLLAKNEETLVSMKFDQLLFFLNNKMLDVYQTGISRAEGDDHNPMAPVYDINQFVQDSVSMNITPFMLDQYANEYTELIRTRDAQLVEMETLRSNNRALQVHVNKLENDLANLNSEHVKILNELVMARLRHEELETELVRYKLLYAEAMHQSEEGQSTQRISMMNLFSRRTSSNTT